MGGTSCVRAYKHAYKRTYMIYSLRCCVAHQVHGWLGDGRRVPVQQEGQEPIGAHPAHLPRPPRSHLRTAGGVFLIVVVVMVVCNHPSVSL